MRTTKDAIKKKKKKLIQDLRGMIRPERGTGQRGFVNNKIYTHARMHAHTHSYSKTQVVLIIKLVCMLWTGVVHPYNSIILYCHFYVLCMLVHMCSL